MILSPWLILDALIAGVSLVVLGFFLMIALWMVVRGFGMGYERVVRAKWRTFDRSDDP